jgi:hypothetical protein
MTLIAVFAAVVVMLKCMDRAADVVLDVRQIAASKVCSSHTETSHQLVEERGSEVSDFLDAVKDVLDPIKKQARLLH